MTAIHWTSPVSDSFDNTADWSSGTVPGAADDAILDAPGTSPYVVLVSDSHTVNSVQTAYNATLSVSGGTFTTTNGTGGGTNQGTIMVGAGGTLANDGAFSDGASFVAAAGISLTGGAVANAGSIVGRLGYNGPPPGFSGGPGGAGVGGAMGGIINSGLIAGGAGGGGGGNDMGPGGGGGNGGDGIYLAGAGDIVNTGTIEGGAGGVGGYGYIMGSGFLGYGPNGAQGSGIVVGSGLITNGDAAHAACLIEGATGVAMTGAGTVTNFATIKGDGGTAVSFASSADRLIAEAGSMCIGAVAGGGGALELAGGTGTISGLGSGTLSGAESMTFSGFGALAIDAGAAWTLRSVNVLSTGQSVAVGGLLTIATALVEQGGAAATAAGGEIDFGSGALFEARGTVLNAGVIGLGGQGPSTTFIVDPAGAALAGGGRVILDDNAGNRIVGGASSAVLTNIDNVISGAGQLGGGSMVLVNEAKGVIVGSLSAPLTIDTGTNTVANAGLILARGSGGVSLHSSVNDSAGGAITVLNGSHVFLGGATLIGGTLTSVGSGAIQTTFGGGGLDGTGSVLDNRATVFVSDSTTLTLAGAIDNAGKIALGSLGATTSLTIGAAGATLSGGGQVLMDNSAANRIAGATSASVLTNIDNRITGAGQLGAGSMMLINEAKGVIVGSLATALVIDTGADTVSNAGLILARGAGGVTIAGAVANTGTLEAAGGTLTAGGAVSGAGSAVVAAGAVNFQSSFSEAVRFTGKTGTLRLARSQTYTGAITGFSTSGGTSLDLGDIGFVSASEATFSGTATSGVLTVTDGTHTAKISLIGDFLGSTFTASSDGHGGTTVVDPARAVASSPPTHQIIAGMAALGATGAAAGSSLADAWREPPPTLLGPRTQTA